MNWKVWVVLLLLGLIFWALLFRLVYGEVLHSAYPTSIIVIDGDTIRMGETRIRLHAVDAPEMRQAGGRDARNRLKYLVATGQIITCTFINQDRYNRLVAKCFDVHGLDLGGEMVRNGYAFAYRNYGEDYAADEHFAKEHRLGLWQGEPVMPWDWRRASRSRVGQ